MMNPATSKKIRVFLLVSAAVVLLFLLAGGLLVLLLSGPEPVGSADDGDSGREHYTLSQHMTRLKIAGQLIWYDTLDALSRTFGGKSESVACPATEEYAEPPGGPDDSAVSQLLP